MPFIADLHIHSKYSRACSKNLDLPHIWAWCQLKGIDLVSTADFTYPAWFKEIHEKLEETAPGIYGLKKEFQKEAADVYIPEKCQRPAHFILSTEISLIYKKGEKTRKVHHVILAPDVKTVAKINVELDKRGNIKSDGRPILGLDSKELLKLLLDIDPDIELIPAHAWTPHFAIFGSVSGFDSMEECFEELSDHIHALETGLSSDPLMNWRLSQNDKYVLVSNSDAHSLPKMGREATVFDCEMTYPAILRALRHDHKQIAGTIEFYPEEGKYHADGLRAEGLCLAPEETKKMKNISPKTGKKITVGVLHRVSDLADRKMGEKPKTARPFWHIIPLTEILAEILQVGGVSKKVDELYSKLLQEVGPEFYILKDAPIADISRVNEMVGEAICRMRASQVIIQPGYDGEYGIIRLFKPEELVGKDQMKLF
ncbi:DNA helicase UvrD [Candidatus Peregrinibacteria bacterium]|nr:DNA helicase UvrD [Candidatus Peregrinibacteria bacterium]